jgi:hypothetical protein
VRQSVLVRLPDPTTVTVPPPDTEDHTPAVTVIVLPSGFPQPICEVVAVVQEITPALMLRVLPSPCRIPLALEVPVGS